MLVLWGLLTAEAVILSVGPNILLKQAQVNVPPSLSEPPLTALQSCGPMTYLYGGVSTDIAYQPPPASTLSLSEILLLFKMFVDPLPPSMVTWSVMPTPHFCTGAYLYEYLVVGTSRHNPRILSRKPAAPETTRQPLTSGHLAKTTFSSPCMD